LYWKYIEKHQNLLKSFEELNKKNFFAGVFGHSHRQLFIGNKKNTLYEMDTYPSDINNDIEQLIINVGSIGQPRGKGLGYVLLNINNNKLHEASFKKIKIDLRNSIELIKQTKLSEDTKEKLINYLKM
jgi:hypothetical protein